MSDDAPLRLYQAFVHQDPASAIKVVEGVRATGTTQDQIFDALFAPALAFLGAAWACDDVDEIAFTQAAVVAEQITSFVTPPSAVLDTGVTVIIGCMHKDRHAVMKNIIVAALRGAGDRVIDLGVDVRPADFLEKVDETGAKIVIVCAEILQTARSVGRVRDMLGGAGRDDVVLLVSGGPFQADVRIAKQAGANGVLRGAESAVHLVAKVAADRLTSAGGPT